MSKESEAYRRRPHSGQGGVRRPGVAADGLRRADLVGSAVLLEPPLAGFLFAFICLLGSTNAETKPTDATNLYLLYTRLKAGATYKYDLSLPPEKMYALVEEMRERIGTTANVVAYGHLGDGNLHLNISAKQYNDSILATIEPFVYEWTSKQRGSISTEHGIGLMKASKIHYSKSAEAVQTMAAIKKVLDHNGILNPYEVLPASVLSPMEAEKPQED